MKNKFTAATTVAINAPVASVWQALTDPALIKQYLFGTDTHTDWKKGSSITYTGEWKGKQYEDKGVIIDIIPEKRLHTTYFSGMSGKEDKPENYNNVIYELKPAANGVTEISITQDNIETEEQVAQSQQNWTTVLNNMKNLLETGQKG
jgi:uncharacterized protein YndB with AHSA1/START domain